MQNAVARWSACGAMAVALLLAPALLALAGAPARAAADAPDQLNQLTAALAPNLQDIKLNSAGGDLAAGKPAKVELTLPPDLHASIQAEAGKLGLGRLARRLSVSAVLTGEGYAITPNGAQTSTLAADRATTFDWQAAPGGGARAPLTAAITGVLNGGATPRSFSLAQVSLDVAPAAPRAATAPATAAHSGIPGLGRLAWIKHKLERRLKLHDLGSFDLSALQAPGHPTVNIPGLGPVPSQKVVIVAILFVIVLLLWGIARNAAARRARAERRRRFRTFESSGFGDDPGHEP